jgi:hypothetical protein
MLDPVRRAHIWVASNVRLGRLNPYILGLTRWRAMARRRKPTPEEARQRLICNLD